ncbi:DUF4307 domain-containing protein [Microbacterium sp.]|uniref:DUF4307 domain-containing protein n=1 Tax=Microbacterium sp. TaxID=51671 RepID=UPI003341A062
MTTAQELDERYGRTPRRRLPWIIAGAVAVLVVGAFGWMTVAGSMNSVDADDLGFDVVDSHTVAVRYQFTAPRGRDVVCFVEALDKEFGIVGWKTVKFSASEAHTRSHETVVPTVSEATTGLVKSCRVA